VECNA
jgi:hypothetical protein